MKTVMVFGAFDILHPGHLYFLKQAKSKGDKLIVVVARDKTIEKVKQHKPKYNQYQRMDNIRELSYVDEVKLGYETDPLEIAEEINPDVICLGYDQKPFFTDNLKEELKKRELKAEIITLGPYKADKYKSSKLRLDSF